MDWIENAISKAREANPEIPSETVDLLKREMENILSKRTATPREQTQIAKSLLATILPKDEPDTEEQ